MDDILKQAIDKHCAKDIFGYELLSRSVKKLNQEFGDVFNVVYLNTLWDALALARMRNNDEWDIRLSPIVFNALKDYEFECFEKQNTTEWQYFKNLLRVFQSDPRTKQNASDNVMSQLLGG